MNSINTNATTTTIGFIALSKLDDFKKRLHELQSRAQQLGLGDWVVKFGETEFRAIEDEHGFAAPGVTVTVTGPSLTIAGYKFLARINHDVKGNVVRKMLDGSTMDASWHQCAPICEHCQQNRARKYTYMLLDTATGAIKQVGSTCVHDFFSAAANNAGELVDAFDGLDALFNSHNLTPSRLGPRKTWGVDAHHLLSLACAIIEKDGAYYSYADAQSMCTASQLGIRTIQSKNAVASMLQPVQIRQGHKDLATKMLAWARTKSGSQTLYMRNIANLANRPFIDGENFGLFASIYNAFADDSRTQARKTVASTHFGNVGSTYRQQLTVTGQISWIGEAYGKPSGSVLFIYSNAAGQEFTSSNLEKDVILDTVLDVEFQVTKHQNDKRTGMPQTRIKVISC
jgi:hypothetical protein